MDSGHGRKFFTMKQLALPQRIVVIILCLLSATPEFIDSASSSSRGLSSTDSAAGALDTTVPGASINQGEEATNTSPIANDATISADISFSSQGEASGAADGTGDGASEHAGATASESTAVESSTNSATSVQSETSDAASTKASTLASKSTSADSSTNSATIVAASSEAVTSINIAPSSGISNSRRTSPKVCKEYLGIENGEIPDGNIAASHSYGTRLPEKGRLNAESFWGCHWPQCKSEATTWIQADIGYQTYVSGVITQGDGTGSSNTAYWVTALKVSTFKMTTEDQQVFVNTDENGGVKVFQANTDRDTPVTSTFPNPIYARIVRITCVSTNKTGGNWQMRFEILGCKQAIHRC